MEARFTSTPDPNKIHNQELKNCPTMRRTLCRLVQSNCRRGNIYDNGLEDSRRLFHSNGGLVVFTNLHTPLRSWYCICKWVNLHITAMNIVLPLIWTISCFSRFNRLDSMKQNVLFIKILKLIISMETDYFLILDKVAVSTNTCLLNVEIPCFILINICSFQCNSIQ